jgi:signal transduction histidine kinase
LQVVDISSSILYEQQKDHSEFLGLVNACVSHELRNPLNSIVAQEILVNKMLEKLNQLYKNLMEQGYLGVPPELRLKLLEEQLEPILNELNKSLYVHKQSTNLMGFLI